MELMALLPPQIYGGEEHVADLQHALTLPVLEAQAARDELLLQARPSTATWGLDRYEKEYGLATDTAMTGEQRLSLWRAKRRGQATTTRAMIEDVARRFSGGGVLVEEFPGQYRFVVSFDGTLGIPPNLKELKAVIEEVKPAHLAVEYLYRYNTYGHLAQFTHAHLAGYTHLQLRQERIQQEG